MMKTNSKRMVGIAAAFAVASELARRDIYAQPTFGHRKRTELLILGKDDRAIRVEARGKQSKQWPNCKGIADSNSVLVLVDFEGKTEKDRPDFYILTVDDWLAFVRKWIQKLPHKKIELDYENCPIWPTEVKAGKPYRGMGVEVKDVSMHKEAWGKIPEMK